MKKISMTLSALALALFLLVGCAKVDSITKAFEKNDYTVEKMEISEESQDVVKSMIFVHKGLDAGVIIELAKNKDVSEAIDDLKKDETVGEDVKAILNLVKDLDVVNGNCVFLSISPSAIEIFKKA